MPLDRGSKDLNLNNNILEVFPTHLKHLIQRYLLLNFRRERGETELRILFFLTNENQQWIVLKTSSPSSCPLNSWGSQIDFTKSIRIGRCSKSCLIKCSILRRSSISIVYEKTHQIHQKQNNEKQMGITRPHPNGGVKRKKKLLRIFQVFSFWASIAKLYWRLRSNLKQSENSDTNVHKLCKLAWIDLVWYLPWHVLLSDDKLSSGSGHSHL